MERAVLADDGTAVDGDDFAVGIGEGDGAESLGVEVGLRVGRHKNGTVDDEIVGIGGRETVVTIIDGTGERELQQAIGPAVDGA